MSWLRDASTIAAFEFRRVFKAKDFVISLVLFCSGALFFAWLKSLQTPETKVAVTVVGGAFELENADYLPFTFRSLPAGDMSEEEARQQVAAGTLDNVVFARSLEDVEVLVHDGAPGWYPELVACLDQARLAERVKQSELSQTQLDGIFANAPIALSTTTEIDFEAREKLNLLAAICLGGMILGLFMGSANLFTGITGEKQNHITESVLSAIPVQVWIDGKCIGLSLVALVGLTSIAVCWMIANQVYGIFYEPPRIPIEIIDVPLFLGFVTIALLGFLMWFAFFAAIAATIDDPNTSSRSTFMFVPAIATGTAFLGLDEPDALLYRLRAVFPLTSPGAMVVRLVKGNVAAWEFASAIVFLIAGIWFFRTVAGRIFGMAMLMRGKELSWRELARAFRTS